jgi:hypothetical protein
MKPYARLDAGNIDAAPICAELQLQLWQDAVHTDGEYWQPRLSQGDLLDAAGLLLMRFWGIRRA